MVRCVLHKRRRPQAADACEAYNNPCLPSGWAGVFLLSEVGRSPATLNRKSPVLARRIVFGRPFRFSALLRLGFFFVVQFFLVLQVSVFCFFLIVLVFEVSGLFGRLGCFVFFLLFPAFSVLCFFFSYLFVGVHGFVPFWRGVVCSRPRQRGSSRNLSSLPVLLCSSKNCHSCAEPPTTQPHMKSIR